MNEERPDQLDQWLAHACWPKADAHAEQRLRAAWREVSNVSRRPILRWQLARAAAVIVVVCGLAAWWVVHPSRGPKPVKHIAAHAMRIGRAPTPLELAILRVTDPTAKQASTTRIAATALAPTTRPVVTAPPSIDVARIAIALRADDLPIRKRTILLQDLLHSGTPQAVRLYLQSVRDPATRELALEVARGSPHPPVDALLAALSDPLVSNRTAAARTLARIDGPAITQRLANMALRNENRQEALRALGMMDTKEANEFLDRAARSGPLAGAARSVVMQSRG